MKRDPFVEPDLARRSSRLQVWSRHPSSICTRRPSDKGEEIEFARSSCCPCDPVLAMVIAVAA